MESHIPQKDRILTDEEFMGKWDMNLNQWILEPKLEYGNNEGLGVICESVKLGDYESAKTELLQFYRQTGRKFHHMSGHRNQQQEILELQMEDIYSTFLCGQEVARNMQKEF